MGLDIATSPNGVVTRRQALIKQYFDRLTAVHLLINGKDHDDLPDGLTVATLISHLGLPERKVAVERNREVVPKSEYSDTLLAAHDELEIIHFIGGG